MISQLINGVGALSSHWAVVIGVSLVFLVVQTILSLKLLAQAWGQNRLLRQLCRRLDRGASGIPASDEPYADFPWLDWVLSIFPVDSARPPRNFTRASVLDELDTRIASESSYLLLQRMGVMAPLLGVVLTVIGFYWLEVDAAGEQSLQTILASVTPLISGVGAGAILALINQILLQAVGGRFERLRMSARTWFDAAIWRRLSFDQPHEAKSNLASMEKFAGILVGAAQRHHESSDQIHSSTAALQRAAAKFEQIVASIQGEIGGVPAALGGIRDATAASAQALQDLIPAGARAVANLDVSVAAFRTTIDHEFHEAAKIHYAASRSLGASVAHLEATSELLKSRADELNHSTQQTSASLTRIDDSLSTAAATLVAASDQVRRTIDDDFNSSQATLHKAATAFALSAEKLAEFIEHGLQPATHDLATLHHHLAGLQETVKSIQQFSSARGDIDRLTATLGQAATIADAISSLPDQVRDILEQNPAQRHDYAVERGRRPWIFNRPR